MHVTIENGNPTPISMPDRWTPRLNGKVFCSPACGHGCKKADFDLATANANALIAKLGAGWQPRVWENGGWHFEATKRGASVTADRNGQYTADIRFHMSESHESCITETSNCPREAVAAVVAVLNERIAVLKRALVSLAIDPLEIQDASVVDVHATLN
jgi:hypothetical protein